MEINEFIGIIPARYSSTRFGKTLVYPRWQAGNPACLRTDLEGSQ